MPKTGLSLSPQGPGILAMRHRGFEEDSPAWDLDKRAALLGFEITGRDDNQTPDSIGNWKEDPDTRGDINCANYWQADYEKRPVGCWAFGYASLISSSQGARGGPAGPFGGGQQGGGPGATQTGSSSGSIEVLPVGAGASPDDRFKPKAPLTLQPEGAAQGDPKSPAANGAQGPNGGAGAGGAGAGGPGAGGGGTDSLSGFNGGYFGGPIGFPFNPLEGTGIGGLSRGQRSGVSFSFGGSGSTAALSGIAGIGFNSNFAGFSGVRNFFAGSGGGVGFTFRFPGQRR